MKVKDMPQTKSERGFTIVELLIVIVVIGILAATPGQVLCRVCHGRVVIGRAGA